MNFKDQLEKELKEQLKLDILLEIPPNDKFGDLAIQSYKLKLSPQDLLKKINLPKYIKKVEIKGPYINFFIDQKVLVKEILKIKKIKNKKSKEKIMVEFSQANTHKAFHIGHIRGTSIGESISRILEFQGKKVIRANYQGDTGMHVAKWIWCYKKYHPKEKLKKDEFWIASIYVEAVKRLAKDEKNQEEVNRINKAIYEGKDKKLITLWKRTRKLSLDALEDIYKELNTKFDIYFFESEVEKKAKSISLNLLKKGIAQESEGAIIIDLKTYNLGVWVLLRKDGTVLYPSKDIALIEKKFKKYKINHSINVVGSEQKLHFQQLAKTLELMNFKHNFTFIHFNLIRLPTGKMSSRTGDNILYSEFIKEMVSYSKYEIKKRFPVLKEKEIETRAKVISLAAIKYAILKQDTNKLITFNKEEAFNFEGESGPYILYSYARASAILRKSKQYNKISLYPPDDIELKLIKQLLNFQETIKLAENKFSPNMIANYSLSIAQTFNEFYHVCQVLNTKEESFRLQLIKSFRIVLKQSLFLLGIDVLEEMYKSLNSNQFNKTLCP